MSIISAGVTTTTSLVQTGNIDGTLQLQVNGTTPSVTLATTGAVGVGSVPSYGTAGQVLTSQGSGAAPTWAAGGGASAATPIALGTVYGKTDSSSLTFLGYQAGNSNTGSFNTAVGSQSMYSNTSGNLNTAVGRESLYFSTTGVHNTAVGHDNLYANTTGSYNTALGSWALQANTTASHSTAVGYQAGYANTTGLITAFGALSGSSITTGDENICVGYKAGSHTIGITTGSRNIMLGQYSQPAAAGTNEQIVIGYNSVGKGATTGFINPNGGGVYQGNNSSSWSTTSDQRLKKNIADNTVGLDAITSIRVRNFEYRVEDEITELPTHCAIKKEGVQLGVIAQELQAVLPECVKQESTGVLSVDTDNLTWYLINAVKELSARVKQLEGN